jgi:hypothetical protein
VANVVQFRRWIFNCITVLGKGCVLMCLAKYGLPVTHSAVVSLLICTRVDGCRLTLISVHGVRTPLTLINVRRWSPCTLINVRRWTPCTLINVRRWTRCTLINVRRWTQCTLINVRHWPPCTLINVRRQQSTRVHTNSETTVESGTGRPYFARHVNTHPLPRTVIQLKIQRRNWTTLATF